MHEPCAPPCATPNPESSAAADTVLAFDFGEARIGVAIGVALTGSARALTTIAEATNAGRFGAIARLVAQWRPGLLVVGLPRNDDGSEHAMSARCRRFANQLQGRFHLPVALVDERYSSLEAERELQRRGLAWQARKRLVDAQAAQVILQSYFQESHDPARR